MSAEKRTVGSEIREFFAEIQEGWRGWRTRTGGRTRTDAGRAHSAALPPDMTVTQLTGDPADEADEITFTPLDPGADATPMTTGKDKPAGVAALATSICPVTRQAINLKGTVYQCRLCGIYYSPEGWEFLRETARGQCCGCRNVKTVLPVVKVR
jgi:hypothetical protein